MWIVAGANTKAKVVEGGRVADRYCRACEKTAHFRECDVKDTFQAFFVDLFDTVQRRMVCTTCGEDHDVTEFFARKASQRPSPKALSSSSTSSQLAASKRDARQKEENDIEEELAALKRKLAKETT